MEFLDRWLPLNQGMMLSPQPADEGGPDAGNHHYIWTSSPTQLVQLGGGFAVVGLRRKPAVTRSVQHVAGKIGAIIQVTQARDDTDGSYSFTVTVTLDPTTGTRTYVSGGTGISSAPDNMSFSGAADGDPTGTVSWGAQNTTLGTFSYDPFGTGAHSMTWISGSTEIRMFPDDPFSLPFNATKILLRTNFTTSAPLGQPMHYRPVGTGFAAVMYTDSIPDAEANIGNVGVAGANSLIDQVGSGWSYNINNYLPLVFNNTVNYIRVNPDCSASGSFGAVSFSREYWAGDGSTMTVSLCDIPGDTPVLTEYSEHELVDVGQEHTFFELEASCSVDANTVFVILLAHQHNHPQPGTGSPFTWDLEYWGIILKRLGDTVEVGTPVKFYRDSFDDATVATFPATFQSNYAIAGLVAPDVPAAMWYVEDTTTGHFVGVPLTVSGTALTVGTPTYIESADASSFSGPYPLYCSPSGEGLVAVAAFSGAHPARLVRVGLSGLTLVQLGSYVDLPWQLFEYTTIVGDGVDFLVAGNVPSAVSTEGLGYVRANLSGDALTVDTANAFIPTDPLIYPYDGDFAGFQNETNQTPLGGSVKVNRSRAIGHTDDWYAWDINRENMSFTDSGIITQTLTGTGRLSNVGLETNTLVLKGSSICVLCDQATAPVGPFDIPTLYSVSLLRLDAGFNNRVEFVSRDVRYRVVGGAK